MNSLNIKMMFGDDPPAGGEGNKGGEGSGEGSGGSGEPEKKFTQADLNRLLADNKRGLQSEVESLKGQLKTSTTEREAFESSVLNAVRDAGIDPDDFDDDGTYHGPALDPRPTGGSGGSPNPPEIQKIVDNINQRWERKLDMKVSALTKELTTEKTARLAAEDRARKKELDVQLAGALTDADVIDVEAGRRYFMPQMVWDEDAETWLFEGKDGVRVDIVKGIEDELPPFLKKSAAQGGAGSRGSSGGSSGGKPRLVDLQQKVSDADKQARKSNAAADVYAHQIALRELRVAERQGVQ